jgi:acetyl esterase
LGADTAKCPEPRITRTFKLKASSRGERARPGGQEEPYVTYHFDPELAPWVVMMPTLDIADLAGARAEMTAAAEHGTSYQPSSPLTVAVRNLPGPEGAPDVRVRLYAPARQTTPLPGLLYLHGGGFVLGSVDTEAGRAQEFAATADAVVMSVDYRLAPEHPFPAGLHDCFAALEYLAKNAAELGVDPQHIGIAGNSAGAGLAAATALMARDLGGPQLCMQYLGIPELDDRLRTPSMTAFTDTPVWNRPNAVLSWQYYLGGEPPTQYAAPARAADLSGLPPTYIDVCEFDPLRDEGIEYAQRLVQAGVHAELHLYPRTFHGSSLIPGAAIAARMFSDANEAVRRLLRA